MRKPLLLTYMAFTLTVRATPVIYDIYGSGQFSLNAREDTGWSVAGGTLDGAVWFNFSRLGVIDLGNILGSNQYAGGYCTAQIGGLSGAICDIRLGNDAGQLDIYDGAHNVLASAALTSAVGPVTYCYTCGAWPDAVQGQFRIIPHMPEPGTWTMVLAGSAVFLLVLLARLGPRSGAPPTEDERINAEVQRRVERARNTSNERT